MAPLVELYGVPHVDLVRWVRKEYGLGGVDTAAINKHRRRREEMAQRVRLYRDDAQQDYNQVIETVYLDKMYKLELQKLVPEASEQNVTGRIIDEVASLYDKPAVRKLVKRDAEFHDEERRLRLHEVMQELHRLMWLCNEVLLWQFKGPDDKTKLRVVTPDMFDPIPHPSDRTVMVGVLVDMCPTRIAVGVDMTKVPHFELWDDKYRYLLTAEGEWIDEAGLPASAPIEHGSGRIPAELLHKREPMDRLLEDRAGRDIISGHFSAFLLNLMMMRLAKSQGENQPVLSGNLASVAAGQPMNGESPIVLPPEVIATVLQTKTDPEHYLKTKKEKLGSLAQRYGLSYEQLVYQDTAAATSGKAYQVRREKLTELRSEQRRRALINEGLIVELIGFDATGMKVDHTEQAIPQDATEEVALLDMKMRLGLDSPIAYLKRKDPDLDDEAAHDLLKANLFDYAWLVVSVRALNIPGTGSVANPGNAPQINGSNKIVETVDPAALVANTNPASGAMTQNHPATGKATAA